MEQSQAAPSVNRVDRWRYRSAVHAARVLNSMGRHDTVNVTLDDRRATDRQPRRIEIPRPRSS